MARIRSVKPDFFRHELLQELEVKHINLKPMLVFSGLWTVCDKAGRFEWKPRTLKLDILPFLDFDMEKTLELLQKSGFIKYYKVDGREYGLIPTFLDHQRITGKEHDAPSKYPDPPRESAKDGDGETPGKQPGIDGGTPGCPGREGKGREGKGTAGKQPDPADLCLVKLLIALMLKNNPESSIIKRLTPAGRAKWVEACRRLREIDGYSEGQIEAVIRFSQQDSFWSGNILSMPTLRDKWDKLVMKMKRADQGGGEYRVSQIGRTDPNRRISANEEALGKALAAWEGEQRSLGRTEAEIKAASPKWTQQWWEKRESEKKP